MQIKVSSIYLTVFALKMTNLSPESAHLLLNMGIKYLETFLPEFNRLTTSIRREVDMIFFVINYLFLFLFLSNS